MKLLSIITVLWALVINVSAKESETVKVFILAGQSNMQGHGATKTLPWLGEDKEYGKLLDKIQNKDKEGWKTRDDVWVFYPRKAGGKEGIKKGKLTVGFGVRDDRIGSELFFGITMGERFKEPVLLVKTCWGGRSLAGNFRPPSSGGTTGKEWKDMLEIVRDVQQNLDTHFPELKGKKAELCGVVWFQGWNDMVNAKHVAEYETNMVNFIRDIRKELGVPKLPFVIGELGVGGATNEKTNQRMKDTRKAQAAPAKMEEFKGNVGFVATSKYWDTHAHEILNKGWIKRNWVDAELKKQFDKMGNQPPYHYLGSAKIMSLIGHGLGEEMNKLLDKNK
eukprot:Seg11286.4 transcript_id=Seg11286.4/GoldUCD/mRNA.D3Y31 product="putative carbohydrate esterase" protein_id=Seg11286.4/GoldUCD/D3Y31